MSGIKQTLFKAIMKSPIYPHIYFVPSPFKIYEFRAMLKAADIRPTDTLLDIGCGAGLQTSLLARKAGRVIGIDVSENVINRAKSEQHELDKQGKIEFRCTPLETAGFAAGQFDKIYSVCVLEHIPNDEEVLREAFRVLKPGGSLVMSIDSLATITDEELKRQHREKFWVLRYYTPEGIRAMLEGIGFTGVTVTPLLCSDTAARWFSEGIRREFQFRYTEAIRVYRQLVEAEAGATDRSRGVYLLIRADKPT
jgi:ubiquinone/menaquinone biosynthesis C-methylase UbiE